VIFEKGLVVHHTSEAPRGAFGSMRDKTKTFAPVAGLSVAMPNACQCNSTFGSPFLPHGKNNPKSLKDFHFWNVLHVGVSFRDEVFGNRRAGIHASASLTVYLTLSHRPLRFAAG
jgi:hypothetical protein